MAIIFTTIHGSHLYGFAHEGSDVDRFTVTDSTRKRARQTIGDEDHVRVGINTFLIRALGGSHQSVEALFSPYKEWNEDFAYMKPFLDNMVVCGSEVYAKYERTIKKFCYGDFKRRRHACRLFLNLRELRQSGRFNPRLDEDQIQYVNSMAMARSNDDLARLLLDSGG